MKMKKTIAVLLVLVCLAALFAGCAKKGGSDGEKTADVASAKTVGEALAFADSDGESASGMSDSSYIAVFKNGGDYWRVIASLTEEQTNAVLALDVAADDYEQQMNALVGALPVTKVENLSAYMLSADEMKALAGKTGEELIADGWTSGSGYELDEMNFYLEHGPFAYKVTFEAPAQALVNSDDFDVMEEIKPLVVKSVEFFSIGTSATDAYPVDADADVK